LEEGIASLPSREDHLRPGRDLWRIISILCGVMRKEDFEVSMREKSGEAVKSYVLSEDTIGKLISSWKDIR
jgi:hypothetical protein